MSMYRILTGGVLCLGLALLGDGCASSGSKVMLNTWSDPAYTPTAASAIAFNIPVGGKPADAAFGQQLLAELKSEAFNVVPDAQADYLLSYVVSDNLSENGESTRDVRVFLYTNPKTQAGSLRLAWQGTITIGKNTSPERETELIKALLADFGKTYNGAVKVGQ